MCILRDPDNGNDRRDDPGHIASIRHPRACHSNLHLVSCMIVLTNLKSLSFLFHEKKNSSLIGMFFLGVGF